MPTQLLDTCIPGKNRAQRIWIAQFENGRFPCCQYAPAALASSSAAGFVPGQIVLVKQQLR